MSAIDVLFICQRNAVRSPMAEYILRKHLDNTKVIASAGLHPDDAVHPIALQVMLGHGIDITPHQPQGIDSYTSTPIKQIIYVGRNPIPDAVKTLANQQDAELNQWQIEEPDMLQGSQQMLKMQYQTIFEQIQRYINDFFTLS